jgi:iron complex outermembrane receptor protein
MKKVIAFLPVLTITSTQSLAGINSDNLFELSLEELMEITVTTVAKNPQKFIETPRAIYVISREDIRRSGVTSIPEALRMAPGVHVAQISSHRWAISIRGFQQEFAGKLLVLIDGRTLYTSTFSGVHWDSNDLVLDNVERIEIMRGPGSVVWGSNAMNGVINIITRDASETQDTRISVLGGNEEKIANLSTGDQMGDWYWRAYAKYLTRDARERDDYSSTELTGTSIHDAWDVGRLGMRADRTSDHQSISITANVYDGDIDDLADGIAMLNPARAEDSYFSGEISGFDISMNCTRAINSNNQWQVRLFLDDSERLDVNVSEQRSVYDIEIQNNFRKGDHSLIYGVGYRFNDSQIQHHLAVSFDPSDDSTNLVNAFIHDDWRLNENWRINFGVKLENDEYTDTSYQPSIGMSWQQKSSQIWFNVERAIRITNRLERDIEANLQAIEADSLYIGQPEGFLQLTGQSEVKEESILAYELGYRKLFSNDVYWDIAGYYFEYKDLIFFESQENTGAPFVNADGQVIVPVQISNTGEGHVAGVEISFAWQLMTDWKMKGSFTYTDMDLRGDPIVDKIEGETPDKQFHIRSYYNLDPDWQLDASIYYVDDVPGFVAEFEDYVRLDLRLAWLLSSQSELVLSGQNLLDDAHREHNEKGFSTFSEVPRSFYMRWDYSF